MVLVTQTHRDPDPYNRVESPRNKPKLLWSIHLLQSRGECAHGDTKAPSRKSHGRTGRQHLKSHTGFCSHSSSQSGKHVNPKPEVLRESESCSAVSDSLQPHGLYTPLDSPGPNTGVGSISLLQGIFPTQESNPGLPHCRWILDQMSHKGSLKLHEISRCRRLHHVRAP